MIIYPAIDLLDGYAVRLRQGNYDEVTRFHHDPLAQVRAFEEAGATWLHLVDLDAAKGEGQSNRKLIETICEATSLRVQIGGGIRSMADIERLLELGASRLILGTAAVTDPDFLREALLRGADEIAVGIDALHGSVRVQGWTQDSGLELVAFGTQMAELGVKRIIYTDISRDGELGGPNLEMCRTLQDRLGIEVILSGGVSRMEDLRMAKAYGLSGAIVGKAIYEGHIDLAQAVLEFGV